MNFSTLYELIKDYLIDIWNEYFKIEQQIFFNDPATTFMERIIELHHEIFFYLIILFFIVFWLLVRVNYLFKHNRYSWNFLHGVEGELLKETQNTKLEIIWTVIPCILLSLIAFPSLILIFSYQPILKSNITFKVVGNQWWWAYEYDKFKNYSLKNFSFFRFFFWDANWTQEDFHLAGDDFLATSKKTNSCVSERILFLSPVETVEQVAEKSDFELTVKFFCFEKKNESLFIESRLIDTEDL